MNHSLDVTKHRFLFCFQSRVLLTLPTNAAEHSLPGPPTQLCYTLVKIRTQGCALLLSHSYQTRNKASLIQSSVLPSHSTPGKHCKTPSLPCAQGMGIQCPFITRHLFRAGAVQSSPTKGVAIVCCSHLGFALQPCLQLRPDNQLSSSINTSPWFHCLHCRNPPLHPQKPQSLKTQPKPANKLLCISTFPAFRNNMKWPWKTLSRVQGQILALPWHQSSGGVPISRAM